MIESSKKPTQRREIVEWCTCWVDSQGGKHTIFRSDSSDAYSLMTQLLKLKKCSWVENRAFMADIIYPYVETS